MAEEYPGKRLEQLKTNLRLIGHNAGRLATATIAGVAGLVSVHTMDARADTLDYPNWDMPCEHYPYNQEGACDNYDWGPKHTEVKDDNSEYSSRGYTYRNCTDYVAWKESTIGVTVPHGSLGNGGQWYDNSPSYMQSRTPASGDAAVVPGNPGHVAYVESVNNDGTITVSEYNHDARGHGDMRTGVASDMGFTEFVDFGVHPDKTVQPPPQPPVGLRTPAVVEDPYSGRQVFFAGGDGAIWQWALSGNGWVRNRIGSSIAGNTSPTAVYDKDTGRNIFFAYGPDHSLHQESVNGNNWVDYPIGGELAANTSPIAIEDPQHGRQVFYVGTDGSINQFSPTQNGWVNYRLGGVAAPNTSPTAIYDPVYGRQVFYIGTDHALYQFGIGPSGDHWYHFRIGGEAAPDTSPAAVYDKDTGRNIFFVNSNHEMEQLAVGPNGWASYGLGGMVAAGSSPNVMEDPNYGRQVFYEGVDQALYQFGVSGGQWYHARIGGSADAGITPASLNDPGTGRNIFYSDENGNIRQLTASDRWNDYMLQ